MEASEVEARLKSVRDWEDKLDDLKEDYKSLMFHAVPPGIDYSRDKVQTSPNPDVMNIHYIDEISNAKREIEYATKQRDEAYIIARVLIRAHPAAKSRRVLTLFYLEHKTIDKIAEEIGYAPRHVSRMKRKAVEKIAEIF